jgi:hypothetical protein
MGYSVYYNGEIDISPELSDEHATLLDEALTKSNPALLGITAEEGKACITAVIGSYPAVA